jgi:hypothetical protein
MKEASYPGEVIMTVKCEAVFRRGKVFCDMSRHCTTQKMLRPDDCGSAT